MDIELLDILAAPFVAALLVVSTHVLLGREVLARGIVFIDLAMAQVAALGMLAASLLDHGHGWHSWFGAIAAVMLVAALLAWTERKVPHLQEPLIGSLYVVAASLTLLLVANHPQGDHQLNSLLAGQLLWVDWQLLQPVAALSALLLLSWFAGLRRIPAAFYFVFALAVTAAVQLVGVLLVFATLILPALASHGAAGRMGWILAYALALLGYSAGLLLSALANLPAGPLIVCLLAGLALLSAAGRALLSAKSSA